jgi:DNA-binding IclR family transcriptional regulator
MLNRSLDLIELLRKHKSGLRLSEMAQLSKLNISTVHRISSILVKRGYLYKPQERGKYYLGLKFLQFNEIADHVALIRDISLPYINKLSNDIGEFTFCTILNVDEARHIAWSIPERTYKLSIEFGTRCPLHCTAVGKVFMSDLSEDRILTIARIKGLKQYTDKTITDIKLLLKEIESVRKTGTAFENSEYALGFSSVAVPIKGKSGRTLAAVGTVGTNTQLTRSRLQELVPAIKACSNEIAVALRF